LAQWPDGNAISSGTSALPRRSASRHDLITLVGELLPTESAAAARVRAHLGKFLDLAGGAFSLNIRLEDLRDGDVSTTGRERPHDPPYRLRLWVCHRPG
jgi:hypothetical protein